MAKKTTTRPRGGRPVEEGPIHTAAWRAKTEDTLDRLNHLRATWLSRAELEPCWAAVVQMVATETRHWPPRLTAWLTALTPAQHQLAIIAEEPVVEPPVPSDVWLKARDLTADAWRATQPQRPPRILRPLMERFSGRVSTSHRAWRTLAQVVAPPAPLPLPPEPTSAADARRQWLEARTAYTRARIEVRRGHMRRADVEEAITRAVQAHTLTWWRAWPLIVERHLDTPDAARQAVEHVRTQTLADLRRAFGQGARRR